MKLVLLPGLDGTGVLFRPLLTALPRDIEPIVIAYPTRQPLGYDQLLPMVVAALPTHDPYLLLGESFGGPLSLRIAATRPPQLQGLILCGSFVTSPIRYIPSWLAPAVRPLPFRFFPLAVKTQAMLGMYETPEHHSLAAEAISQVAPNVFAHRVREILRVDAQEELRKCDVPILYIQGTRDRIVDAANLRRILRINPNVRCIQIDSGHMILKTRPVESASAIAEFASSCQMGFQGS
jgi:pimeloyl-[acyl-carrier protein] methyl ester esterase